MNESRTREFLGSGLAFPFRLDGDGRLAMNHLEDQVAQSIRLILATNPGERVMRPEFGAGLRPMAFEPLNSSTAALVKHQVEEALARFEPRIEVLQVTVDAVTRASNRLDVAIDYRVRDTDNTFNLVHPFYLERGES